MNALVNATRRQHQRLAVSLVTRLGGHRERGDVPGWVLITLMTAGLVTVIWSVAGDQLKSLFENAINAVTGPGAKP